MNPVNRQAHIARSSELMDLYQDYRILDTRSRDVRYRLLRLTTSEVEHLLQNELTRIEETIKSLLAQT